MSFTVFQVDRGGEMLEPYELERARLEAAGGVLVDGRCTTEDEVIAAAGEAEVLWLNWAPGLTRRVFEGLPACRLAIRWGVGYDQIDTEAATELGIAVANAPEWASDDVAEHAVGLLLAVSRLIARNDAAIHAGEWPRAKLGTVRRVRDRTIGIVGVGRIGSAMARRAAGLGMRVIGYDIARPDDELSAIGVEPVDLATLQGRADVVSLHVPLSESSRGLVDAAFLAALRPGTILLNTSRGPVVDTAALLAALESGQVAAAGLDVFEEEPLPVENPLRGLPNVVMTPHVAAFSDESWQDLREEMCRTTIEFMRTGWSAAVVNPEVRSRLRR